jgi:hypothetical protein
MARGVPQLLIMAAAFKLRNTTIIDRRGLWPGMNRVAVKIMILGVEITRDRQI